MTGFERGSCGIGSDRAINCVSTTAQYYKEFLLAFVLHCPSINFTHSHGDEQP